MFGLDIERHDDLVDAFTTLILGIIEKPPSNYSGPISIKLDLHKRGKGPSLINDWINRNNRIKKPGSREDWNKFIDDETKREFDQ